MNDAYKKAVEVFAKDKDIQDYIKRVEKGIKTTQDNYGKYMQFLSTMAESTQGKKRSVLISVLSDALIVAGANMFGVNAAKRILNG